MSAADRRPERIAEALERIDGLTISDCLQYFGKQATPRDLAIVAYGREVGDILDGHFEVDQPIVTENDEGLAFVLGWRPIDIRHTELDTRKST